MRMYPALLLVVGLTLAACGDPAGPTTGTLVVSITTATTGLDPDPDGYRILVDGTDRGAISANATLPIRLDRGSRTLALAGLASNCTIDGPDSRAVTIVDNEVVPVAFAVVCTATSGVIRVVVGASGTDLDGEYQAMVDRTPFFVRPGEPAYLAPVSAGAHVVTLVAPLNCSVETDPQPVTVTAGSLIRDTVEVAFSVTCAKSFGTLRITARFTGLTPRVTAWICEAIGYECTDDPWTFLGALEPNGTLVAQAAPGSYRLRLKYPLGCGWELGRSPTFTLTHGGTVEFEVTIRCSGGTLQITAPTIGHIPSHGYSVWICDAYDCYFPDAPTRLGALEPNGTLVAEVLPGSYSLQLNDIPASCSVQGDNPRFVGIEQGRTLDVEFPVACSP